VPLTPKKRLGPRTVTDRTNGLAARVRCFAVRAAQSYRQGGGHKQRYRLVDFKRPGDATAEVVRLEYDPNRSAWIALVKNMESGEVRARAARDRGDGGGSWIAKQLGLVAVSVRAGLAAVVHSRAQGHRRGRQGAERRQRRHQGKSPASRD